MPEIVKTMPKADVKARLAAEGGMSRGNSHGGAETHIGGFGGCISLKVRDGAAHYVAAVNVAVAQSVVGEMDTIVVLKKAASAPYLTHCMAHGIQVASPTRAAAIQNARTAGAFNPKAAKATAHGWCHRCVKANTSAETEA